MSIELAGVGVLQAVVYLLFIRAVDLYERESFFYVIPVFVWGFTVAVIISLLFESVVEYTLSAVATAKVARLVTAVVGAPVIEECAKGLALLLVFVVSYLVARHRGAIEFSGVMDGIVYGSAVGFGFSIAEDLFYYAHFGPQAFIVRRIFGGFAHAAFTSLTGVGFGLIPWVRSSFLKVLLPILGLAGAILLHATFNFTATLLGPLAYAFLLAVVILYVLLIIVWLAVERRVIRNELRDEMYDGTISPEEYAMMPTYFRRKAHYAKLVLSGHLRAWHRSRKAHALAVDLAFTKRLARRTRSPWQQDRANKLRRRIWGLQDVSSPGAGA